MIACARRPERAALALAFVLAATSLLIEPSLASPPPSSTAVQVSAGSGTTHRHVRRYRRPPAGGCYARCAVVIDPVTDQVFYEKNADRATPIASLTKLMTAMVLLEQQPDFSREVEVTRDELSGGGHTQLRSHERLALGDLLHMSLMCSDNVATRVLVRESGLPPDEFLARMNAKAQELGLENTHFVEFTGLDENNVSTASDVARMLKAAAGFDLIHSITTTSFYDFTSDRRLHRVTNTNRLLKSRYVILGGKTGFISESGYCFATWLRAEGRDMIAVVLGAPTNATRFADVVRLVQRTVASGFSAKS